jgi:hypothetical protein
VADNTTAEGATARSQVSLLKRLANLLIASLAAVQPPLKDTWPQPVTTGASALLSASLTFPAGTFKLGLVPSDATIKVYLAKTTATSASAEIPPGGISFFVTKAVADALAVYSASANKLSVYVGQ